MRIGDRIKWSCGDTVCRRDNPRHTGEVKAVLWDITVRVRWHDSRWISDEDADDLVLISKA